MSTVDERTDVEAIEHLDWEISCDIRIVPAIRVLGVDIPLAESEPCGRPASAILACRTCGIRGNVCAQHGLVVAATPLIACSTCHVAGPGLAVYEFIPVGGHP